MLSIQKNGGGTTRSRSAAGCPAACSATLCHRHIGQRFALCLGAFLHFLMVLLKIFFLQVLLLLVLIAQE